MARTTGSPTSRRSGRASGRGATGTADAERETDEPRADAADERDEQDDDTEEAEDLNTGELIAAALLGAAVGAGLGLLASRYVDADDIRARVVSGARRMNRGLRRGVSRGVKQVRRRARDLPDLPDVGEYAARARAAFEDALEREVKSLRRGARRQRRRFGF